MSDSNFAIPKETQVQQTILAYLRHELRTPMNAVNGYSEILLEELADIEQQKGQEELEEVNVCGQEILDSINTILNPVSLISEDFSLDLARYQEEIKKELQPPLNKITSYCQLLFEKLNSQEMRSDLDKISAAAQDLSAMIENLSTLAQHKWQEVISEESLEENLIEKLEIQVSGNLEQNLTSSHILVVDDNPTNRDLLSRQLEKQSYSVATSVNGQQALEMLAKNNYDLIILDVIMPQMNGYEVLKHLKANPAWRHIPTIVISSLGELDSAVKCIEMGAVDYLPKPCNSVLLQARISACLEKKRLRDREIIYINQLSQANEKIENLNKRLKGDNAQLNQLNGQLQVEIQERQKAESELRLEKEKSERLILNILPQKIAEELKQNPGSIARRFEQVTILFADLVNFTQLASLLSPTELVNLLNEIVSAFDRLADKYGLEKIKTIGDAYLVVGGLPVPAANHAEAIAEMALAMQEEIAKFREVNGRPFQIRIGINTGSVVAGVIGLKKFVYDLWGDAVNVASRMESQGLAGEIQVTETTHQLLKDKYYLEKRGKIAIKGKGKMTTYFLKGRK